MSRDNSPPFDETDGDLSEEIEPADIEATRVFDAYLAGLEEGRPADPERLLAEHPKIAIQLRAFLNVTQLVGQVTGDGDAAPVLEDYRIRRVVARGGMGIVYEAEQISRGRRVALKVLLSAAALDPRQLKRFQIEVQAARLLRHPHIVPVASFGCERGVYYYAMQFVESQNLADLIKELGQAGGHSDFSKAARWGLQAAEALDHAHEQGVLHRDIKPSNLLVDTHGNLWVTDFGLAQVRGEDGLTRTGDLLGTLRYMSPEQALGKRLVIDGRTDIYSLGVTLYELLTLRPAFDGDDRRELLRRIAEEEPRAPRRIAAAIPRDLETIALKAMVKEREYRYATARELADDLKLFLEDRPIRARPPSLLDRLAKWARHHRPAVAVAFVILFVTVVALTAGTALIAREQRRATRESIIQQQQRIRLTQHADGWSDRAWKLVREAAAIRVSDDLEGEAAAILIGMDAKDPKRIPIPACSLAFDRAGARLLIGGTGREATLWHTATDQAETLEQNGPGSGPVAFRADGTPVQLVLGGLPARCSLQLRDLAGRKLLSRFDVPQKGEPESLTTRDVPEMTLTPDASLAALAIPRPDGTGKVFVWDGGTGMLRHQFGDRASALAFSADGSLLATGDGGGQITIRSLATGATLATLQAGRVTIQCLAFGHDARRRPADATGHDGAGWLLASGDAGGTVVVWDIGAKVPRTFCHGSHYDIYGVAFAPDGSTLASCGRVDVRLWDIATGRLLLSMASGNHLGHPVFSPDGRSLAVLSSSGWRAGSLYEVVVVWTLENGRGIRTFGGLSSQVSKVIFSSDGKRVAALSHDWRVAVWDHDTGRLRHVFDAPRGRAADNAALAFSPDGRQFAFCAGNEAKLWDLDSGRVLCTWPLAPGMLDLLAFHPSGKLLLFRVETLSGHQNPFDDAGLGEEPRVCRIRDLLGPDPQRPLAEIGAFNAQIFESAAPLNGNYFVVEGIHRDFTGQRRSIRAFDGPTGAELWSMPVTKTRQYARLATDPTGKVLAILTGDAYRATLVEMPGGRILGTMKGFPDTVGAGADRLIVKGVAGPGGYCESFTLVDGHDGRALALLGIDTKISSLLNPISHDGRQLAWGSADGSVFVCDLAAAQRRLSSVQMGW